MLLFSAPSLLPPCSSTKLPKIKSRQQANPPYTINPSQIRNQNQNQNQNRNRNRNRNWLLSDRSTSNTNTNTNPDPKYCCLQPELLILSSSSSTAEEDDEAAISRGTLLWRAAKLPIYSVALIPLTVGCSAAYLQTGLFSIKRYLVLLISSVLIITWLNLSNDVYDFDTGADRHKKESVVNIVGSRRVTQIAANVSIVLGFIGLIWAFKEAGDVRFILLVSCAILCGYVYQCPPFRLSYQGLGEPLCFAAFGPFATTAFYFSNSSQSLPIGTGKLPLTSTVIAASILVGLTTTLILFCSHFHQIDGDKNVGKMSPLVRLGTERGSKLVRYGVGVLYLLLFAFSLCKFLPPACAILCALTLPMGKLVVNFVEENRNDKLKIFMAKYYCVRLHALFGAALAISLLLSRALPLLL